MLYRKPCSSITNIKKNPRVFLLELMCISAGTIAGATSHSALEINKGAKLSGLNDKAKASIRNELSKVKLLMIDEISMVSNNF